MDLHNDDKPVGRVLTRREILRLIGGGGAALITGLSAPRLLMAQDAATATPSAALPACIVRPELTEGPYFVDDQLNRRDIRIDPSDGSIKDGLPLRLIYRVSDVTGGACAPLAGAQVDVWHCDADGVYSGVQDAGFDTSGQTWLRGYQVTDEDGIAEFLTIVPGWYSGRAVHIHFKIRTDPADDQGYEFTSRLFFDPDQIAEVYADVPYAAKGLPDTPNSTDGIFQQSGGVLTVALSPLTVEELTALDVTSGVSATFDIGLDLSDAGAGDDDSASAGGGRSGRRP
ncbi:MAG: intradiol ring-cleavage dioxygenase [Anaerolineae bacterium]|nr:intradiol ring-cleavage dioxygenase [Anaerolineae bacterium]NUQ04401.1 intradiol ring-cleavage dioxygenase [Anaerolineae bacterium]